MSSIPNSAMPRARADNAPVPARTPTPLMLFLGIAVAPTLIALGTGTLMLDRFFGRFVRAGQHAQR